jgi:hypothetical protein
MIFGTIIVYDKRFWLTFIGFWLVMKVQATEVACFFIQAPRKGKKGHSSLSQGMLAKPANCPYHSSMSTPLA